MYVLKNVFEVKIDRRWLWNGSENLEMNVGYSIILCCLFMYSSDDFFPSTVDQLLH